jgi:hypothetical protein
MFKLSSSNIEELRGKPETGMGYQIIKAYEHYFPKEFLVINGKFAIDTTDKNFRQIFNQLYGKDIETEFRQAKEIHLAITDIAGGGKGIGSFVQEGGSGKDQSAKEGKKENANGDELFVRLSAFEDDIRIDKVNRCLRPGSFTTTASDALRCKVDNNNPIERYALPNELKIEWAFYIEPSPQDSLQRGWVQPDFGKKGEGREVYFEKGTSNRTFVAQSKWEHEYNSATK